MPPIPCCCEDSADILVFVVGPLPGRDDHDDDDDVFVDSDTSGVSVTSPKRRSLSLSALKEEPKSPRKVCYPSRSEVAAKRPHT